MGDSKLKIHNLATHSDVCIWRQAAVFDNCVDDPMNHGLIGTLDPESNEGMVWLGWHLEGEAKLLHFSFRKNPATKELVGTGFLTQLRQFCIAFINKDQLWTELQGMEWTHNSSPRPVQEIPNKIKQMQLLLPTISNWESHHQLLERMYPPLLAAVRPFLYDSMELKELLQQCEIHDTMQYTKKQPDKSYYKHGSKLRLPQQTHHTSCNPSSSTKPHCQAKSDQKPTNA